MSDSNETTHPGRWQMLQALAGELPASEREALERHCHKCPACGSEIELLQEQQERFCTLHPPEQVLEQLIERRAATPPPRRRALQVAVVLAGLAALVILTWRGFGTPPHTRTKGGLALQAFRLRQGKIARVYSGEHFRAGDRLQFAYSAGSPGFLFLASIDERGRVFNYNYQAAPRSLPAAAGSSRVTEGSILLDDSPLDERVFAVLSPQPLDFATVAEAARRGLAAVRRQGGNLEQLERLPLPYPQDSFLLRKRAPAAP